MDARHVRRRQRDLGPARPRVANRADFEDFGQVAFETRPGYNNSQVRFALLNEQQATLLMTFQRNTDQVRAFKKAFRPLPSAEESPKRRRGR